MTVKEYLNNKPRDEYFDLMPSKNISRDIRDYYDHEILKIEEKNGRKIIYV